MNTVRQFNTGDYCLCRYVDETEAMYYGGLFNVYMMSGTSGNKALVTDGFPSTGTGYMNECILTLINRILWHCLIITCCCIAGEF